MYRYDPIEHCKWCGVDYDANARSIHCPHRPKLAQAEDNIRRMRPGLKTEVRSEPDAHTRMLALRREAAFEIIGLEKPNVDRVEEIIALLLERLSECSEK
jgi:hypothetical protein